MKGTVVLDFDSTLIICESLEEIIKKKNRNEKVFKAIQEITKQGMEGKKSFLSSLQERLSLVSLAREDVLSFGQEVIQLITPGMEKLIQELTEKSIEVWIVSGALREVLLPVGKKLGVPKERLLGVDVLWSFEGKYRGIDDTVPLHRSKWEGVLNLALDWPSPRISIGDGATDYALYEHGCVDYFIAFTQNVRREVMIQKEVPEAKNLLELRHLLKQKGVL